MAKYIKKPVEIEAVKWTGKNTDEINKFTNYQVTWLDNLVKYHNPSEQYRSIILEIQTLEGRTRASIGDYIVKEKNRFCVYKSDVFEQTCEKI